jgi:helicase
MMPQVIRIEDQNELVPTSNYPHANWKFANFNPVQSRLIDIYNGNANATIAAATAAGKTVSSEIFAAYEIRKNKKKMLYIGPLKSLVKEKHQDWTKLDYHFGDLKVSICSGDYRLTNNRIKELEAADIIVMTPEMLASRCRNHKSEKSQFLHHIGCVVFDESHLLGVPSRGDHIEIALMKLTEINPECRVILLSATLPNVPEVCGWVSKLTGRDTYYLESKYRPCPLHIHYEKYFDGGKKYEDKENEKVGSAVGIVNYYSEDKFLVFVHTKRTGQLVLAALKRAGIEAEFHNADLDAAKRDALEKKFKEDPKFRCVVATSTLAWGVNLPSRRVVIVGVDRGLQPVENYDIWQMAGRAGRPAFDPRGDVYILVPESSEKDVITRLNKKTPIRSQLLDDIGGHHKTLAFHIVSEIHHGNVKTKEGFHNWFARSFAAHQNQDFSDVELDKLIDLLVKCKAVKIEDDEYRVTMTGTVASMFYFSPFDVADLKENFKKLFENHWEKDDVRLAVALSDIDSNRWGIVNKNERAEMLKFQLQVEQKFGKGTIKESAIKTAFGYHNLMTGQDNPVFGALQAGLRADSERTLEVLNAVDTMSAKWNEGSYFNTIRLRLTYGVRTELVDLCRIPNVGKVRAERLFASGVKNMDDFLKTPVDKLSLAMNLTVDKAKESQDAARQIKLKDMMG